MLIPLFLVIQGSALAFAGYEYVKTSRDLEEMRAGDE